MSEEVVRSLMGFAQAAFFGAAQAAVEPDFDAVFDRLAAHRTLRAETVSNWPAPARQGLRAILTAWISVLQHMVVIGEPVPFPPGFLDGCSSTRLGPQIVAEIQRKEADLRSLALRMRKAQPDRQRAN